MSSGQASVLLGYWPFASLISVSLPLTPTRRRTTGTKMGVALRSTPKGKTTAKKILTQEQRYWRTKDSIWRYTAPRPWIKHYIKHCLNPSIPYTKMNRTTLVSIPNVQSIFNRCTRPVTAGLRLLSNRFPTPGIQLLSFDHLFSPTI